MIPIVPTLALAILSFLSSAFVVLRIAIPVLPPHPLSRRVPPSAFGLPNFGKLSQADKAHLWLAALDIVGLCLFLWQAVEEYFGESFGFTEATDPLSSIRLWLSLTLRQLVLLIIAGMALVHIRMGRSMSYGTAHWRVWAPTLLLAILSTIVAAVVCASGVPSLFIGLAIYSTAVLVLTCGAFVALVVTLLVIRRNLERVDAPYGTWPPFKNGVGEQPRPSFDIRDGSSWITSTARSHSRRTSFVSTWSFSSYNTGTVAHPAAASHPSIPEKSSFWFKTGTEKGGVPPVPPLPSPYRPPVGHEFGDLPADHTGVVSARQRLGSQTSWMTSDNGSQVTLSSWSYPTTETHGASSSDLRAELLQKSSSTQPAAMASAQVLGGYGYVSPDVEKGAAGRADSGKQVNASISSLLAWLLLICLPFGLSMPYFFIGHTANPGVAPLLLVLSVTLSAPLLAINVMVRLGFPIPTSLFESTGSLPYALRSGSVATTATLGAPPSYYKRSGSVTVVEGRRSGDVWIAKGDAVDGKGKYSRAFSMMSAKPKLSVLPPMTSEKEEATTPPLPIQEDPTSLFDSAQQSELSGELGKRFTAKSTASSKFSAMDETAAHSARIMVAQRHYSAVATTVNVPASPDKEVEGASSGVRTSVGGHLRARSTSSINFSLPRSVTGGVDTTSSAGQPSPPPAIPLPPTPPSVRAHRLAHKKSVSFATALTDAVAGGDMNEIDALSAGVLPGLVPGLKIGKDVKITKERSPFNTVDQNRGKTHKKRSVSSEFGSLGDWESPQMHSTPKSQKKTKKAVLHKKHHYSLPSLGLGKNGAQSLSNWKTDVASALDTKAAKYATISHSDVARRNTVWGGEAGAGSAVHLLRPVKEEEEPARGAPSFGRSHSVRANGSALDVPSNARDSVATLIAEVASNNFPHPHSAASTATFFELDHGPMAESTPHNSINPNKRDRSRAAAERAERRSSIKYIKTQDENNAHNIAQRATSSNQTWAQWSWNAVKPLLSKLQEATAPETTQASTSGSLGSPSGGLRPLSLLTERNTDVNARPGVPPLALGRQQRPRAGNGLKPLKLGRSESTRQRGFLRKDEVVPDVVVRPPSNAELDNGFTHPFN